MLRPKELKNAVKQILMTEYGRGHFTDDARTETVAERIVEQILVMQQAPVSKSQVKRLSAQMEEARKDFMADSEAHFDPTNMRKVTHE